MEIQRYNRQINNIGSATRCERRDGSEFLRTDSYIEMASFLKNYYTKSCPIRIIVVSLHSETARQSGGQEL